MSLMAFAEGLYVGYEFFLMHRIETKVKDLEKELDSVKGRLHDIDDRLSASSKVIQRLSNYNAMTVREKANQLLARRKAARPKNVDAVSVLVASLGGTISAITFKGKKRRSIADGILDYRGFIAGTQSIDRIFYGLGKMAELSSLTGGRIVTSCVASREDMEAAGLAIAAFYHIASVMGLKFCPMSDENTHSQELVVRFEGRYDLKEYAAITQKREHRTEIIHAARKNIYILGTNGVGKSSWGNLITGEDTFEVGMSDHTTMIPQSCDIERGLGFRLWDTPGLFDGTEDALLMEEHMNSIIDVNAYCSGVLFVFSGAVPPNQTTKDTLQYAKEKFGSHVCKSFVVIINDIARMGRGRRGAYVQMLHDSGYLVTDRNVFVASAVNDTENVAAILQRKLGTLRSQLVKEYQVKYQRIINREGGLANAVMAAHISSRRELERLLKQGKIEVVRYRADGPKRHINLSVPKDVIIFRQHSKGYFSRKLGIGTDRVLQERSVLLKGPSSFKMKIRAHLNMEYQIDQVGTFLAHVLSNPNHILIHTPQFKYDYELRDITEISKEQFRHEIIETILEIREREK